MQPAIAFFDIEASSLTGCPIEIGWAIPQIHTADIIRGSALIKPPNIWCIADHWDEAAEALHGITLADLVEHGLSLDAILSQMNAALDGFTLYADAPAWDLPWLDALLAAAHTPPRFAVAPDDALTLIGRTARAQGWSPQGFAAAIAALEGTNPHCHRAGPDAARLAALWHVVIRPPQRPDAAPFNPP